MKKKIKLIQEKLEIQDKFMIQNDYKNWELFLQLCKNNEGKGVMLLNQEEFEEGCHENDWVTVSSIENFKKNFGFN